MQSLRDKLLKAGLITEDQAKKTKPDAAPKRNSGTYIVARPQAPTPPTAIPKLPPLPGSKAHQRLESKRQLELDRQLRELVQGNQLALETGGQTFYFVTRKGRLRRLELSEGQVKLLEAGEVAIVERREPAQIEHSLVPAETAEKMFALSDKAVRFFNRPGAPIGFVSEEERSAGEQQGPETMDAGETEPGPETSSESNV